MKFQDDKIQEVYEKMLKINEGDDLVDLEGAFEEISVALNVVEKYLKTGLIEDDSKLLNKMKNQLKKTKKESDKLFELFDEELINI